MTYIHLTETLIDNFYALADEVQSLTDRKTVLEHKLRFAHEQFQYLADKHAPAAPEISETLAKLQLPPDLAYPSSINNATCVPLPKRRVGDANHHIALVIRDGRKAAQQLASIAEPSKTSLSSRETFSRLTDTATSMSTALEQDFTVEGTKGSLACPFSTLPQDTCQDNSGEGEAGGSPVEDPTPHKSTDPICAAMFEQETSQPPRTAGASKCPIRYMDKHTPEQIAEYVKAHKHDLPRSHAVCVDRYQRNDAQVRMLDAKYGDVASMIEGLGHLHKPLMPISEATPGDREADRNVSNQRVETWAQDVSTKASQFPPADELPSRAEGSQVQANEEPPDEPDREGHFDRPMKEVRVGESPSRPWGISVPVYDVHETGNHGPPSPPPAPVLMPASSEGNAHQSEVPPKRAGKCPFDHTKMTAGLSGLGLSRPNADAIADDKASQAGRKAPTERPSSPQKEQQPNANATPAQATFLNALPQVGAVDGNAPQMVFTGPVFIGYPMDQAIQFMQAYQSR